MDNNIFAERFSLLLNRTNLTYEQIAKKLDIKSKGTISKYATGKVKKIDRTMVIKISKFFDVSPVWLLGFTDDIDCKLGKD